MPEPNVSIFEAECWNFSIWKLNKIKIKPKCLCYVISFDSRDEILLCRSCVNMSNLFALMLFVVKIMLRFRISLIFFTFIMKESTIAMVWIVSDWDKDFVFKFFSRVEKLTDRFNQLHVIFVTFCSVLSGRMDVIGFHILSDILASI